MSTSIIIEGLVKQYAPGTQPAVDHVSLTVNPGELFFLLGPSGCGKTTLLRMIAGFIDPTGGVIRFSTGPRDAGRDVTHLPPNQRNTGMVFQSYALWPHMTVFDNVAFGLTIRKIAKDEIRRRVTEALEMVQMAHLAERKPNALSGGQQQRVALARALVIRPDVLLLDEPLSNLDAKLRVDLRGEIRRICKSSGITTVYVTHDQKEALSMADSVAIMKLGQVMQLGGPGELYRAPKSKFVAEFLGETNFLPGTIVGSTGPSRLTVQTPVGQLVSSHPAPEGAAGGSPVLVSLRPEALRIGPASQALGSSAGLSNAVTNELRGSVRESTYLGEISQHTIALTEQHLVKVAQLNPGLAGPVPNSAMTLSVHPDDVVLVRPDAQKA
jgi:iron(III) transport system ATP-binding protein